MLGLSISQARVYTAIQSSFLGSWEDCQRPGTTNQPHRNAAGQLVISSSIPRADAGARPYRINGQRPGTTNHPHGNAAGQQVAAGDLWDDESCF
ncbi:hypothetical protein I6M49_12500 [Shewanella algae]|uniref:hypothetical protein n=1 Tax=Shewanella algae TaxID=38313 RepID=UPI001AACECF8|nr:hypothetical protein [Shewanella algae]MBO2654278.1 hypothetical protein [Shewanella algae]